MRKLSLKFVSSPRAKTWLFSVLTLFVTVGACEVLLRSAVTRHGTVERVLGKPWYYLVPLDLPDEMPSIQAEPGDYRVYDPDLGWSLGILGRSEPLYYSDRRGFRCSKAEHEAAAASPPIEPALLRYDVVALGDSFTHGDEVMFDQSWPARLAVHSGLNVLNLGVGGYGVDQAVLRYEKVPVEADHVLLGLIAGDLERAQTQVYNFSRGGLKTKPIFVFENKVARLENRPAIYGEALRHELLAAEASSFLKRERIWGPELFQKSPFDTLYLSRVPRSIWIGAKFRVDPILYTPGPMHENSLDILEYARQAAEKRGARFTVVLLGNNNSFQLREQIEDPWHVLKRGMRERRIHYFDATRRLYARYRKERSLVINSDGVHYTPDANNIVARQVADFLAESPGRDDS